MYVTHVLSENVYCNKIVDFYVPVTFEFPQNEDNLSETLYYQYISRLSSLVEIAVNSKTKKIIRVAIVSANDTFSLMNFETAEKNGVRKLIGNPEIDTECFAETNVIQIKENIQFGYSNESIIASLSNAASYEITMGDLTLLLDEKKSVAGFAFSGFTEDEGELLKEALQIG